jgi:hypothetical protein
MYAETIKVYRVLVGKLKKMDQKRTHSMER